MKQVDLLRYFVNTKKAPEVTRKRLYIETMEEIFSDVEKVIIDEKNGGQGVVPYLPLNDLRRENK